MTGMWIQEDRQSKTWLHYMQRSWTSDVLELGSPDFNCREIGVGLKRGQWSCATVPEKIVVKSFNLDSDTIPYSVKKSIRGDSYWNLMNRCMMYA